MPKHFDDFQTETTFQPTDHLVGFRHTNTGGERRWTYQSLVNSLPTIPTGIVAHFASTSAPAGWLECNGATIPNSGTTAALYAFLASAGNPFGGVGKIPDLRGRFIRSFGTDSTVSPVVSSAAFGEKQSDAFQGHTHAGVLFTGTLSYAIGCCGTGVPVWNPSTPGTPLTFTNSGTPRYGAETRPANVALLACIKL